MIHEESDEHFEHEVKFAVRDLKQVDLLCTMPQLSATLILGPVATTQHVDLYLDTPDYSLLRHGIALRRRQQPGGVLWTAKEVAPAEKHKRLEIETKSMPDAAERAPAAFLEALQARLGADISLRHNKLIPVATIQQTRHKRLIRPAGDAAPIAELSIDDVYIYASDRLPQNSSGVDVSALPRLTSFWEVEVELLPGQDEGILEPLTKKLAKLRALRPQTESKFERALTMNLSHLLLTGQYVRQLQPTMTMADGCRLILRQQLTRLLLNESGVRRNKDIEFVHRMRVAIRRMRTALKLFGDHFRTKALRKFHDPLRITGRRLGAVRDLDVALLKLNPRETGAGQTRNQGGIADEWQRQRQDAFAALIAWLDSADYQDFVAQFANFCATAGKGNRKSHRRPEKVFKPYQVRHVVPLEIATRFAQVRTYEVLFDNEQAAPLPALHRLRIACKELRYLLEFSKPLLGRSALRLIDDLKQLQEKLGDLNDATVMLEKLEMFVESGGEAATSNIDAAQAAEIAQLRGEATSQFLAFVGAKNRTRVAQAWSSL